LIPCWVRPVEGGSIHRFHETQGLRGSIRVSQIVEWQNLKGERTGESVREYEYGPYEVVSFIIKG
jgi:hypothetical protein